MRKTIKSFATAIGCLLLASGCIQTINPQNDKVTAEQATAAPGSFDKFVSAITSSLAGSFIYKDTDKLPWDFGYPSFLLQRDVMGQDMALEDVSWYSTWYACGNGLGSVYRDAQLPWTYYYKWIKNCNTVLSITGETPLAEQRQGAGIAYAMRAMFYMDLARMYAPQTYAKNKKAETVPLVLETTSPADATNNPRATNEAIWKQILADLDKAEDYLADYRRSDVYTPDLSVVYGLKARAYLTMEDWANAGKYASKAKEGYTPMTAEAFTSPTNGFNTPNGAWMFGVIYKATDPNILENDSDSSWGSQMVLEVSASECGYAANYGDPKHIDSHLYSTIPGSDFRKSSFIDFQLDGQDKPKQLEALKAYSDAPEGILKSAEASQSKALGGLSVKFRPKDGEHSNQKLAFAVAVPLMRVEEMMLIEAEAAGMQNESEGIRLLTAFAKTRDADYVYGTHQAETYGSSYATPFQNEVWWQRRVELWGEGFATFDIKRLDKAVIRSYAGTNHPEGSRWNAGIYGVNNGNSYPNWMDLCITIMETNYNSGCITNNPTPLKPKQDSPEFTW